MMDRNTRLFWTEVGVLLLVAVALWAGSWALFYWMEAR